MKSGQQIQTLYGNLEKNGIQLQRITHQKSDKVVISFCDNCLLLLLNMKGHNAFSTGGAQISLGTNTLGLLHHSTPSQDLYSSLDCDHELLIVSISLSWVKRSFGRQSCALHPDLQKLLNNPQGSPPSQIGKSRAMSLTEQELATQLIEPNVAPQARIFWYSAKLLELFSIYFFVLPTNGFCSQQEALTKQRVRKVVTWLDKHLDQKLDLQKLALYVGCSPYYLSRIFSAAQGHTITQHLRKIRIDKAAECLRAGDYNVTEAALEVGYNSLSHFSKAFLAEKGVQPSQYLSQAC